MAGLALALLIQCAAAAMFFPALGLSRRVRGVAAAAVMVLIALGPLAISAGAPLLRVIAAIVAAVLMMKVYDVHVGVGRGIRPSLGGYLAFLLNLFSLVQRKVRFENRPAARDSRTALARASLAFAGLSAALIAQMRVSWGAFPFLLEHAVKATLIFLWFVAVAAVVANGLRLAGVTMRDLTDAPWQARTPAEFWRRYNRPIHQFLREDVFGISGGGSPVRAVLLVFAVSAVAHEYIFGIALERVQGYWTAFFALQAVAVIATARIKPRGAVAPLARGMTVAFLLLTAILVFASFHHAVRIYARPLPSWLLW